jgi:hypothetical protein
MPHAFVPSAKGKWRLEMTEAQVLGSATHASFTSQTMLAKAVPAMCPTKERAVGAWRRWLVFPGGVGKVSATVQSSRRLERSGAGSKWPWSD